MKDKRMSVQELEQVNGGADGKLGIFEGPMKTVSGLKTGWLALRTAPSYDPKNEIGQLYNNEKVQVIGNDSDNGYTWVYAPSLNKSGWVNSNFIK